MQPITLAEKLAKENYQIKPIECAMCGKRFSQDEVVWIGTDCCPVCLKCYRALRRNRL